MAKLISTSSKPIARRTNLPAALRIKQAALFAAACVLAVGAALLVARHDAGKNSKGVPDEKTRLDRCAEESAIADRLMGRPASTPALAKIKCAAGQK